MSTATRALELKVETSPSMSTPFSSLSCTWKTTGAVTPPRTTNPSLTSSPRASVSTDLDGSIAPPLERTVNSRAAPPIKSPSPAALTETLAR